MSEPLKEYEGALRAKIAILGPEECRVEWLDLAGNVVWAETVKPKAGYSFMSQIVGEGRFRTEPGHFVDGDGKRHFVMKCDPGRIGSLFGDVHAFSDGSTPSV